MRNHAHLFSWHFDRRPFYQVIFFLFHLQVAYTFIQRTTTFALPFICRTTKKRQCKRNNQQHVAQMWKGDGTEENSKFNANDLIYSYNVQCSGSHTNTHNIYVYKYIYALAHLLHRILSVSHAWTVFFSVLWTKQDEHKKVRENSWRKRYAKQQLQYAVAEIKMFANIFAILSDSRRNGHSVGLLNKRCMYVYVNVFCSTNE